MIGTGRALQEGVLRPLRVSKINALGRSVSRRGSDGVAEKR